MIRRRCARGDDGAILPFVALILTVLITASALAVDLGHGQLLRRDLQKVADAIALDLARQLDGSAPSAYNDALGAKHAAFVAATDASRARNDFSAGGRRQLTSEAGCWNATTQTWTTDATTCPAATATKVVTTDVIDYWFYPGSGTSTRTGYATRDATLDYQVGSFLVGTNPSANQISLLNTILARLFGNATPFTLDAVSYQGLASGQVSMRQLAAAYGLASPTQLFTGNVHTRDLINAYADALNSNGGSAASVTALRNIAATVSNTSQMDFNSVVDPGTAVSGSSGNGAVFDTEVSALGLLTGTAFVMNGTNTISVPSLGVTIPNLASVDVTLKVIEGPQIKLGAHVGDVLTTSQVDVGMTAHIDLDASALLTGARLRGDVTVKPSAGGAAASPTSIRCSDASTSPGATVALNATPLSAVASESLTLSAKVLLSTIDVLNTTVTNATVSTTSSGGSADFAYSSEFLPNVGSGGTKRLGSSTLNLSGALSATNANSTVLNATLPVGTLLGTVNTVLTTSVLPSIQNSLLPLITQTLGLNVGGGDVGAIDEHCDGVKLAG